MSHQVSSTDRRGRLGVESSWRFQRRASSQVTSTPHSAPAVILCRHRRGRIEQIEFGVLHATKAQKAHILSTLISDGSYRLSQLMMSHSRISRHVR